MISFVGRDYKSLQLSLANGLPCWYAVSTTDLATWSTIEVGLCVIAGSMATFPPTSANYSWEGQAFYNLQSEQNFVQRDTDCFKSLRSNW